MYVLKNCKLIPELTEGTTLTAAHILIENEKISKILPLDAPIPQDADVLDVGGKTVMPGLIDAHIHLRWKAEFGKEKHPCELAFIVMDYAQYMLDNGYTTLRDVGDNKAFPCVYLKRAINAGQFDGPRIFTSGPTLMPQEYGCDSIESETGHHYADNPDEMRKWCRYVLTKGADFIKLYGSGSMMVDDGLPGAMIMTEDEMRTAVMIAEMKQTYCAVHSHGAQSCYVAATSGIRTIEHASFIEADTLRYLDGRRDQGLVFTLACLSELGPEGSDSLVARRKRSVYEHLRQVRDYDILVGWGTDVSLKFYKEHPYAEFQQRKQFLNYTNAELLQQATINSAKLIMKDDIIGSVKEGKYADLIVIDGDPVANLEAMYKKPVHVLKGGKLIR